MRLLVATTKRTSPFVSLVFVVASVLLLLPGHGTTALLFSHALQLEQEGGSSPSTFAPIKRYNWPPTKNLIVALTTDISLEQLQLCAVVQPDCSIDPSHMAGLPAATFPFPSLCTQAALDQDLQRRKSAIEPLEQSISRAVASLQSTKKRKRKEAAEAAASVARTAAAAAEAVPAPAVPAPVAGL
jgi:hypothetical protein